MKKKRIVLIPWSLLVLLIIMIMSVICIFIWFTVDANSQNLENDMPMFLKVFINILLLVIFSFLVLCLGGIISWIKVDEDSIVMRTTWFTIRKTAISDITEIKQIKMPVNKRFPICPYFMLIDKQEGKVCIFTCMTRKGEFIKVKGSKRNEQFLNEILPDVKITDMTEEDIAEYKRCGMFKKM